MRYHNNCDTCPALPRKPHDCGCCELCNEKKHETKYFKLPLWRANDVTSWMVGLNGAMMKIDSLFHQFALRTGIDGADDDLISTVEQLQKQVDSFEEWRKTAGEDIIGTNKIVSGILGTIDVMNEKIRQLSYNYSNIDTRMLTAENQIGNVASMTNKLTENLDAVMTELKELTLRVENLENRVPVPGPEPEPNPEPGPVVPDPIDPGVDGEDGEENELS